MAMTDIAVATIEAPRRRDDTLPEHEEMWPATDEVMAAVRARYDGTSSTSKEIGLDYVNRNLLTYPSWRIEQIARQLGIADEKRDAILQRVREEEAAPHNFNNRTTGKPVKSIEEAIAAAPKCRECGKPFEPWKSGLRFNRKTCRNCFSQRMIAVRARRGTAAEPAPVAEPVSEPEPVYVAGPNFPTEILSTLPTIAQSGAIRELLDLLPTNGRWTGRRRYRWLAAFTATLDLLIDDDRDDETREVLG